jgi:type II secretory pathway predicted ATPase ExeA
LVLFVAGVGEDRFEVAVACSERSDDRRMQHAGAGVRIADRLRAHYGFSRLPFGKNLAPGMLHAHGAHDEAVARMSWCISEQAIGVISGECGAGKTVAARAAVAGLDASRHTVLYLGTPGVGLRGIYGLIITTLDGTPRFHHAALIPQAQELLGAESAASEWC